MAKNTSKSPQRKETFVQEQLYLEIPDFIEEKENDSKEKDDEEIERGVYIIELF